MGEEVVDRVDLGLLSLLLPGVLNRRIDQVALDLAGNAVGVGKSHLRQDRFDRLQLLGQLLFVFSINVGKRVEAEVGPRADIDIFALGQPAHLFIGIAHIDEPHLGAHRPGGDHEVVVVGVFAENIQGADLPLAPDKQQRRIAAAGKIGLHRQDTRRSGRGGNGVALDVFEVSACQIEPEGK